QQLAPVVSSLGAAILTSGRADDIESLFAYLERTTDQDAWLHEAILAGVDRFIPGEGDRQRTAFLPEAPDALIAFAKGEGELASRARAALQYLRWQGQSIDPAKALASLNEEQRRLFERGRTEFAVCAACHQADGRGMEGLAPALVGSRWATGGAD